MPIHAFNSDQTGGSIGGILQFGSFMHSAVMFLKRKKTVDAPVP